MPDQFGNPLPNEELEPNAQSRLSTSPFGPSNISPTEASISSHVSLDVLQRAAVALDAFPEDIAHLPRDQLLRAAKLHDQTANRGGTFANAPFDSGFAQIELQRAIVEGSDIIAGIDLGNIDPSLISGRGKDKLRAAGFDPDNDPIDIQDLIDARVNAGELKRSFGETLTGLGLMDKSKGATADGRGIFFNQSAIETIRNGLFPEQREVREAIAERVSQAAGSLDPDTFIQDPLIQAALQTNAQGVRAAYASRGLNASGAAALSETATGLQVLEGLRQQREQELLGLTDVGGVLSLGGNSGTAAAGIFDKVFQQSLGADVLNFQVNSVQDAQRAVERAGSFPELFKTNFAASFGSSLGTLSGIGGIIGGSGGSTTTTTGEGDNQTITKQNNGGSGLTGLVSLFT